MVNKDRLRIKRSIVCLSLCIVSVYVVSVALFLFVCVCIVSVCLCVHCFLRMCMRSSSER